MRIPIFAAIVLAILSVLTDLYIDSDIRKYSSVKHRRAFSRTYRVSSWLCWAFFIVILFLPKRSEDQSIICVMWMFFTYLSIYFAKFFYCICSMLGRLFARKNSLINYGAWVGIVLAIFAFGSMWWGACITRRNIDIQHTEIVSDRLPDSFNGFRIVQFSDAHVGTWGNDTSFVSKLVDSINAQKPDMILFTGDVVNRQSSELKPFVKIFSRLRAKHGVYSVLGNHDYSGYVNWASKADSIADHNALIEMEKSMGWDLLQNENRTIRIDSDSIMLIGVENWGEPPFNTIGDLKKSYPAQSGRNNHLNDDNFKILMTHNPSHWTQVVTKKSNIDLTLSGHTHAMQCEVSIGNWKWSPCVFRYKTWGGLYDTESKDHRPMDLYVNIGSGEVGFPARIGATPEITVLTLKKSNN